MCRLLIFHPALAPYRVDFFNLLGKEFDTRLVLFDRNLFNQKFDQKALTRRLNCSVEYLPHGIRWKDRYFRAGVIRKIWAYKPDVVIGCEYSAATISIALYRFLFRRQFKLYTITDDNLFQFNSRHGLKGILRKMFVRMLNGIVVTNREVAEAYRNMTPAGRSICYPIIPIVHDRMVVQPDFERMAQRGMCWRKRNIHSDCRVLLFVGRLDPEKNVGWLIGQMKGLSNCCLVIVGSGSEESALKKMAKGLRNVIFMGRKEGRSVFELMSMADVLVLPSSFEPYGAVVGEALMMGTPCLVSDRVGAKSLIVGKKQGGIYAFNDSVDFHCNLTKILATSRCRESLLSVDLREAVGEFVDIVKNHF